MTHATLLWSHWQDLLDHFAWGLLSARFTVASPSGSPPWPSMSKETHRYPVVLGRGTPLRLEGHGIVRRIRPPGTPTASIRSPDQSG